VDSLAPVEGEKMKYASQTEVSSERSRAEIERTVTRYGASGFSYGWQDGQAAVSFIIRNRRVRFIVPLPKQADFRMTANLRSRTEKAAQAAWEQACRQRWRALLLAIKAKLEAVESQIATFEEEFLAYIVLPDNTTVGQFMAPQIEAAYSEGRMPLLLPGIGETSATN
jgi:hypothetical protein